MRLNQSHKINIVHVITNRLTAPFNSETKEALEQRLQQWVYTKAKPSFKVYMDDYPNADHIRDVIAYDRRDWWESYKLKVFVPKRDFLDNTIPSKYTSDPDWVPNDDPVLQSIIDDFRAVCKENDEFNKVMEEIKALIDSAKTDKELMSMFPDPEFDIKGILSKTGVTAETKKHLPATTALTEQLTKWRKDR